MLCDTCQGPVADPRAKVEIEFGAMHGVGIAHSIGPIRESHECWCEECSDECIIHSARHERVQAQCLIVGTKQSRVGVEQREGGTTQKLKLEEVTRAEEGGHM